MVPPSHHHHHHLNWYLPRTSSCLCAIAAPPACDQVDIYFSVKYLVLVYRALYSNKLSTLYLNFTPPYKVRRLLNRYIN